MSLSEALPTTAIDTVGVYTPKRYRQLQVKDFPKVPTWWLERDSNPRPSGQKASTLPMHLHAQQMSPYVLLLAIQQLACHKLFLTLVHLRFLHKIDISILVLPGCTTYVVFRYWIYALLDWSTEPPC